MAGSLITQNGQAQIRDLLIGAGTPFPFVDDGPDWWNKPSVTTTDVKRARSGGVLAQVDTDDALPVIAEILLAGDSDEVFQARRDELIQAWRTESQDVSLAFRWAGETRIRWGRARNASVPSTWVGADNSAVAVVQFVATDPRMFSAVERSASTGVGEVTGGLGFPHGFPHGFGFASPGVAEIRNDGSESAPWTASLVGPLASPAITLVGSGRTLAFGGLSLAAGETLVLDSRERTVRHGTADGPSRYGSLTERDWFDLPSGQSLVQLTAAGGTGSLTVSWRDTWI